MTPLFDGCGSETTANARLDVFKLASLELKVDLFAALLWNGRRHAGRREKMMITAG